MLALFTGGGGGQPDRRRAQALSLLRAARCDARPVSAATVARNGYLVALAVIGTGSTDGASTAAALGMAAVTVTGDAGRPAPLRLNRYAGRRSGEISERFGFVRSRPDSSGVVLGQVTPRSGSSQATPSSSSGL